MTTENDTRIRMCSSGSTETADADVLQADDLDSYTTAHIRRFCETMDSLLAPGDGKKKESNTALVS